VGQLIPAPVLIGLGMVGSVLLSMFQGQTQWGVFDSKGKPLWGQAGLTLSVSSVLSSLIGGSGPVLSTNSVEYSKEMRVSEYPVERGGFASYNKVETPGRPIVTFCLTGKASDRSSFLNAIDAACKSTNLYSVVTPEATYINHTIERYNYSRRRESGATLLTVELYLVEVRQVSAQYTQSQQQSQVNQPQKASATPAQDTGMVQSQAPQESLLSRGMSKLGSSLGFGGGS
jgi:hypothetical protein